MGGARGGLAAVLLGALLFLGGALSFPEPAAAQTPTGICDRTQQVQDAILRQLPPGTACGDVTPEDLKSIETLSLGAGLTSLQSGDFAGLTRLETLLIVRAQLTGLPPTVFNGLRRLKKLAVVHNAELISLPATLFNGLRRLEELDLSALRLTGGVPATLLNRLSRLRVLRLDLRGVRSLPATLLNGLNGLESLELRGISFTSLPPGFFAGLGKLTKVEVRRTGFLERPEIPLDVSVAPAGGDNCFRARIAQGAPVAAPVKYRAIVRPPGGGAEYEVDGTGSIAAGRTESANVCVPLRASASGTRIIVSLIEPSFGKLPPGQLEGLYYTEAAPLNLRIGSAPTDTHAAIYVGPRKAEEGTDIVFPVRLSSALSSALTVRWKTEDGTAQAPDDYTAVTGGTLTIAAGGTTGEITVSTVEEDVREWHETLKVKFDTAATVLPSGVVWGVTEAEGTIGNDDTGVRIHGGRALEGDDVPCSISLTHVVVGLLRFPTRPTPGTAGSSDYRVGATVIVRDNHVGPVARLGTLTQDAVVEGDETFTFNLGLPHAPGMTVKLDTGPATCTITDDDRATISVSDAWAYEGDDVTFAVAMSNPAVSDVVLSWATEHISTEGHDYDPVIGGTLTIRAGGTRGTLTVKTRADTRIEGRETFRVRLSPSSAGLPGGVSLGDPVGIGTIRDRPAGVTLAATVPDNGGTTDTVSEDDGVRTVTVTATLDGRPRFGRDRVVWVSVGSGSAAEGTDFTVAGEPFGITIPAGTKSATGTFTLDPDEDTIVEGTETVAVSGVVHQYGSTAADGSVTVTSATVNIADTTAAPTKIVLTASPGSVDEDADPTAANITVTATIDGRPRFGRDRVVWVSVGSGSAAEGTDFTVAGEPFGITIPAGAKSATGTFTLDPDEDTIVEGTETVAVSGVVHQYGSTAADGSVTVTSATVNIADTTAAPTKIVLTASPGSVDEDADPTAANITVTATIDGSTTWSTAQTVRVSVGSGTAVSGTDFTAVTDFDITIPAGSSSGQGTFTLDPTDDAVAEGDETVAVSGALAGVTVAGATVTIEDDDAAEITIADAKAEEGTGVVFTVTLSNASDEAVSVLWSTSRGTAGSDDYTAASAQTLTIAAGSTSGTLTVATTEDTVAEGDEDFKVTLSAPSSGLPSRVALASDKEATGTIEDDDDAEITIADAKAEEGTGVVFTVTLSNASDEAVSVLWSTSHDTAGSDDYTAASAQTLTIAAGSTSGTLTVQTTEDTVAEGDEDFKVTLSAPSARLPSRVALASDKEATGTIEDDDAAEITIADAEAEEGTGVVFTVTLSNASDEAVSVLWSTSHDTAGSDDYTAASAQTLTIAAGSTSGTLTVATTEDTVAEGDETFEVTLSAPSSGLPSRVALASDKEATGTIEDDDDAEITIADAAAEEGTGVVFTVTLSNASDEAVSVLWSTSHGTAGSDDYTAASAQTLTIAAGSTSGTLTVATTEDTVAEGDETFEVTLSAPSALPAGVSIADATATGTIRNDDSSTISIADAEATEGGVVTFTVTLGKASSSNVVLKWVTSDGTAGSGDYTAQSNGSLTIAAGSTSGTLTVQTTGDQIAEGDETFEVTLSAPSALPAGVSIADATATGTIADDDTAGVSIADAEATEGGVVTFTVTLGKASSSNVVLKWVTSDGTAGSGDYTAQSNGSLTIAAGSTSGTLTVQTTGDQIAEGDETFEVTLSAPSALPAGVSIADATATGTIADDDTAGVSIADAEATEGGVVTFTVTLGKASSSNVVLKWVTSDGTAGSGDYTAQSNGSLTIAAGSTSGTLTVQTTGDQIAEGDETFEVTLSAPSALPAGVSIADATATGTIRNDDSSTISIADAEATEGGVVTFTVTLGKASSSNVVLKWVTSDGTAGSGDYTAQSNGSLTIAAGSTSGTLTVQTTGDQIAEGDETFEVTLSAPSALPAGVSIADATATGTIADDDTAGVSIADAEATEGGVVTFTVTLGKASSSNVVLKWVTSDGTAGSGDYTAQSNGSLTIAAGSTSGTLTVQTTGDQIAEGDETFEVTLSAPSALPAGVSIADATATGTIADDDTAGVSIADAEATEGGVVTFTVTLGKASSSNVVLKWVTSDGTAGSGDYTAQSNGSLTIAAGSTSGTLTVQTTGDQIAEGDETFEVTLSAPSALPAGVSIADATATGTIADDDTAGVSIADAEATEGGVVTFTVTLGKASSSNVVLKWVTSDGTAGSGDYTAQSNGSLTIAAGSTSGTLTVQTTGDQIAEGDETFEVTLSAPSALPAGVSIADATATGTIADDDTAGVSIADAEATEGGVVTFTVTLGKASSSNVVLKWVTSDGTAGSGDYTAQSNGSLTIAAGSTSGTLTVQTTGDQIAEGDETFEVTLSAPSALPAGVSIADATATGTIADDDTAGVTGDAAVTVNENEAAVGAYGVTGAPPAETVVWSLAGADAGTFVIDGDGALAFRSAPDFEAQTDAGHDNIYDVAVEAATGGGRALASLAVAVTVADMAEPPPAPEAPTVTGASNVSLAVTWTAPVVPDGTPPITGYKLQYREEGASGSWISHDHPDTSTAAAIAGLAPGTSYEVQVMAFNHEGDSGWSPSGAGATGRAVSIAIADGRAREGREVVFTVTLSSTAGIDVVLNWTTADGTAKVSDDTAIPDDYTEADGTLTILDGGTSGTIAVQTVEDGMAEADETFLVVLSAPAAGLPDWVVLTDAEAVGTIEDDDAAPARIVLSAERKHSNLWWSFRII